MKTTASDILIDAVHDWGVDVVFGLPGDGINGIMEALRKRADKIRFIQVRHEEAAAFMACAYAKYTGKLGVCLATSGPGGIHLMNGLYDAKLDGQPVLAITGLQYHDLVQTHTQQDVELDKVFMDVAVYNTRVMSASHVENVVDLACRTALAYHGVSHITIPVDTQEEEIDRRHLSKRNIPHHTSDVCAMGAQVPPVKDLERAAYVLNSGKRIAILAGRGALGAADELELLAETLGAPIIKALLGKAAVPDSSPFTTGGIGLLGTKPSQDAMENCDTLLMIGTSFPYIEFLPKPGQARGIQIELDPMRIGLRFPVEAGLVGDAKHTMQRLLPLLKRNKYRRFLERAQYGMRQWWALMEAYGTRMDKPMIFVIKNNTLGQIKWEQMVFLGNPEYGCDLHPINFALFAQACGGTGLTIEDPADCATIVEQALNTPGPVLVQAVVDPYEPPMPPKVSMRQAGKFAESLVRGEPNRGKIISTVAEDRVRELV